jgi:hypothetical protein
MLDLLGLIYHTLSASFPFLPFALLILCIMLGLALYT